MNRLIDFLDITDNSRCDAAAIWPLIEPRIGGIIERSYKLVQLADSEFAFGDAALARLRQGQQRHWRILFESRFDERYFNSASLIGISHRELGLDPKWLIAGYTRMKNEFMAAIFDAPMPLAAKTARTATLNKYVALDMSLALSSYTALLVD